MNRREFLKGAALGRAATPDVSSVEMVLKPLGGNPA